jgi:hypothetical protein
MNRFRYSARKLVGLGFGNLETIPTWEHLAVSSVPQEHLSMADTL